MKSNLKNPLRSKRDKGGLSVLRKMQENKAKHKLKFSIGDYVGFASEKYEKDFSGIVYKVVKANNFGYSCVCVSKESLCGEYRAKRYFNTYDKKTFEEFFAVVNFELLKALHLPVEFKVCTKEDFKPEEFTPTIREYP